SDQYALAVITYEWLCGERPFTGNIAEISSQHLRALAKPVSNKVEGLPMAVDDVLRVAMEKNPHKRFVSIQAFARALEQACDGVSEPIKATYTEEGPTLRNTQTPTPVPLPAQPVLERAYQPLDPTVASGPIPVVQPHTDPQPYPLSYPQAGNYP